jgi:predicted transcriptional regulator
MPTSGATLRDRPRSGGELRKAEASARSHKHASARSVLALTRRRDTVSVAELSQSTRLSKTTVKKTLDLLASMKLVVSAGKGSSTEEGGKRPELYRFNESYGYVTSVQVTPDAIIAVTTDLRGDITYYRKASVDEPHWGRYSSPAPGP